MKSVHRWIGKLLARGNRPQAHMRRPRLHLELLEDRITPNTYTVSNLNDSGTGSLRQAIIDSNSAGGSNTIVFSTTGTLTLERPAPCRPSPTISALTAPVRAP